jgi:biopolymer transport protein ExbB/TolQ
MDIGPILVVAGYAIYAAMAAAALLGVYHVILLLRRISQKRFKNRGASDQFLVSIRDDLKRGNFTGIEETCDSPRYWSKAVSQLILIALENRDRSITKLRRLLAERFEREVLADLEYRTSWVATIVKSAPMLGLLGTVVGMINAFAKIAAATDTGTDPKALADDISFALFTTAMGLTIAIPLVMAGAVVHVRIGKLQDSVQDHLGEFLDDLETIKSNSAGSA